MTPGTLIAWVGSVALSLVIIILTVAIVVALVRNIRHPDGTRAPRRSKSTKIIP